MNAFMQISELTKEYGVGDQKILAANGMNFTVNEGDFTVVLGPSGSGKSTLLNILGGMDRASAGQVVIDGKEITAFSKKELNDYRRREIGFVFQFYNLLPNLTARENVELASKLSLDPLDSDSALDLVGLRERSNHFPAELSGGEQQRVSIARAVCKNPKLLLCDEPTGALDSETGIKVLSLLWEMCKEYNRTVLLVTHNQAIAEAGDRIICLRDGQVVDLITNKNPLPIGEVQW